MTDESRPLLITADPLLLDDVVRLAAAAGVEVTVREDPHASAWSRAPIVFVGDDVLVTAAARALPRRDSRSREELRNALCDEHGLPI